MHVTMDSKDLEAEIHPLRNEDKRLPETPGNPGHADEKLKSSPRQPRLSRCRTVVFFLSLFVCLFVVFVVSFIIPCPERPVSQGMWRIDYSAAGVPRGPVLGWGAGGTGRPRAVCTKGGARLTTFWNLKKPQISGPGL